MHWGAVQHSNIIAESAMPDLIGNVVVDVPDYQGNSEMSPSGVTVLRSLINVSCSWSPTIIAGGTARILVQVAWGLCVVDKDQTVVPDPGSSIDLVSERWLQVGQFQMMLWNHTLVGDAGSPPKEFTIDCKQRARLRDQQLLFCVAFATLITNAGDCSLNLMTQCRTLLAGNIT